MKNVFFLAIALLGTSAMGSHTVCASPSLYYSSIRHDFGTPPRPGTELGSLTIFSQGKVLVSQKYVQGLGGFTLPKYEVTFEGPKKILEQTGVPVSGKVVYTETAVLSTAAPHAKEELLRTPVVCEQTWAFVP